MKNKAIIILAVIAAAVLTGCTGTQQQGMTNESVQVTTTIYPLYEFAQVVGGEHVKATMLLPAGAEPHSYEPKPSDILAVKDADIFIYIGDEMEPWAHDILEGVNNPTLTIIEAADFAEVIGGHEEEHEHAEEEHAEEEHHHEHAYDPHLWLSLHNDILIVEHLAQELSRLDPQNAAQYNANAQSYVKELEALDQKYRQTLANCAKEEFISGGHDVFGYLEHEYGIRGIDAIENLEPNTEPTPARMKEISDLVKEHDIKYVLTEVLVSSQVAEAISEETGAQVLTFNPAPNLPKKDFEAGTRFISIMESNLVTLATALECS